MVLAALLAGCAGTQPVTAGGPDPTPTGATAGVAAPTADLTARRAALGIAPCPTAARVSPTGPAAAGAGGTSTGLPAVPTPCLDGTGPLDLSTLRGTPTVVNLWATWCGPCRIEAPFLAEVSSQLGGKVRFVGVDVADPDPAAALEFAGSSRWAYAQVADPDRRFASALGVAGIPQTLLVDPDGTIVYRHAGALTSADQLRQLVHDHLGVG